MKSLKADHLIIGAGLAGMVTAIELCTSGKKVLVIDRDEEKNLGGLARESFGGITIINSPVQIKAKIKDNPELAYDDWQSVAQFSDVDVWPKAWAKTYVENSRKIIFDWLTKFGVKFFPVVHWVERGMFRPGNSVPRFHMVWGTGHGLIEALKAPFYEHVKKGNLTIQFGYNVKQLLQEGTNIVGCQGVCTSGDKKEDFTITAPITVVAAGGICGDIERVKKNWHPDFGTPPEVLLNGAHRYGNGALHDAVAQVGGNLTYMNRQWHYAAGVNHPNPNKPHHGLSLVPPKSALWLNWRGERIGPVPLLTAYDTRYLVEQICAQEKKFSWQVMNWKIAKKELAVSGSQYNEAIRDKKLLQFLKVVLLGNEKLVADLTTHCKDFVVADTLDELVNKMNALQGDQAIDPATVKAEVKKYDDNIKRGSAFHNDDQLRRLQHLRGYRGDRVRTCKFQTIDDPGAGPLIAIREFILARKTLGGIQTNLECQVLTETGQAINGLFAIGEASGFGGGGSHGIGALEGTFLGGCILTGRYAAASILRKNIQTL